MSKDANTDQANVGRQFRRDLQSLDELLILELTCRAPDTQTFGTVVVFGLNQLDVALTSGATGGSSDDVSALDQSGYDMMHPGETFGSKPQGETSFAHRWRDALLAHLGADEVQAIALDLRKAHHGDTE